MAATPRPSEIKKALEDAKKVLESTEEKIPIGGARLDAIKRELDTWITVYSASDAAETFHQLKQTDPTLKKVAAGTSLAEAALKVVVTALETKLDLGIALLKKTGGSLQAVESLTAAKSAVQKYLGRPVAVIGIVTSSINLIEAIGARDERGIVDSSVGILSATASLFGTAGGAAGALIVWYSQGAVIMGRLGGILQGFERSARIAEASALCFAARNLALEARKYNRRLSVLMYRATEMNEAVDAYRDRVLRDHAQDMAHHLHQVRIGIGKLRSVTTIARATVAGINLQRVTQEIDRTLAGSTPREEHPRRPRMLLFGDDRTVRKAVRLAARLVAYRLEAEGTRGRARLKQLQLVLNQIRRLN